MTSNADLEARIAELEAAQQTADTLFQISRGLNTASDELALLQILAQPALKVGATKAVLYYIDLDNQAEPAWIEVVASIDTTDNEQADFPVGTRFHLPEFSLAQLFMAEPNKPLLISNMFTDPQVSDEARSIFETIGNCAWVIIPLTQSDRWVGNIQFIWDEPYQFTTHEIEIYHALIGLAAATLENRRLVKNLEQMIDERTAKLSQEITERERTEKELEAYRWQLEDLVISRTHRLQVVATLSSRLNAILDFDQLLTELVRQVDKNFNYYHTQVYIVDNQRENLVMQAGVGEIGTAMKAQNHAILLKAETSLVARAARKQRVITVADVNADPTWLPNPLLPETRSEMAVPIIVEDTVVGVLDVQQNEVAALDEGDANLLQSLANQVAITLHNADLFEQAHQQATDLREEISQRRRAEKDLRTFKTLVENAPDGILVTDLEGRVTYANISYRRSMGHGDEIIGLDLSRLVPEEQLSQLNSVRLEKVFKQEAWQGFMPHRRIDGVAVPMQASMFLIRDRHQQPRALAAINHNITELKKAEEAIMESEKKFYSLYVSMNEALALFELVYDDLERPIDYKFIDINPTYEAMTGLKWEDVINKKASEVYGSSALRYLGTYHWVASSAETTSFEAVHELTKKVVRVSVFSPARGQFATILQDITQRKLMEERMSNYNRILEEEVASRTEELTAALENLQSTQSQLVESEKMAALGSLVAGVAHEINTPVGIGVSMASLLQHETSKVVNMVKTGKIKVSVLKEYLQTAQESSRLILNNLNRAAELVQSFKQVAVDQTSLECRDFLVCAYIEEILLSLRHVMKRTQHNVTVEGDRQLILNSFPGSFSQVVSNLVINSLHHAYEDDDMGNIQFTVVQEQDWVTIIYQDDGVGITPENLEKIFEPFFTTARSQGGSGLGLHIVYNLVTQTLGGKIACESEIGRGTKFTLELPAKQRH
ncbi:ATP-binding protein [Anaerolineales bacterium HSG25]|nr:ATP-binding protein [Anaerolineales bacterium HSG25]